MSKKANAARRFRRLIRKRLEASADQSMEMNCEVTLELEAAEGEGQLPRFRMLAYSGGPMRPKGFDHDVVVDLSTVEAANMKLPILRDHDQSKVIGHGELQAAGGALHVAGEISGAGPEAQEVVAASKNGFPWQASIGARPKLEMIAAGDSVVVNGARHRGPLYVARNTVIREVSFVAVGADPHTSAEIAASGPSTGSTDMKFEEWLKATTGLDASGFSDEQLETLKAKFESEQNADDNNQDLEDSTLAAAGDTDVGDDDTVTMQRKAAAEEARRTLGIQAAAKDYPDLVPEAIEAGWSVEKVEFEVAKKELAKLREARPQSGPAIHAHDNSLKDNARTLECSLAIAGGLSQDQAAKQYDEKTVDAASDAKMRGMGLHRLMHEVIKAAGDSYQIGLYDDDFIRTTFKASEKLEASGFSTLSLPGILSNVANKTMLASYQMYPSIVPFAFDVTSAPDFKPLYRYRLEGEGILEKLGADGEIKHASLEEQDYMNRVSTYARMLGITRQMMINDDLNALTQVAAKLGEMAFKAHEYAAVDLIVNPPQYKGVDFYSATHGNLINDALSINGLTQAETAFGDQTDSEGYPISVMAERLLVPNALKITASSLMTEAIVNETTTTDTPSPRNNPHAGAYDYRATAWLSNGMVSNASATAWWLLASPGSLAAFEVAYLRGSQTPVIESASTDFNTLGTQFRSYFDFGFAIQDFRGVVKSTGTV